MNQPTPEERMEILNSLRSDDDISADVETLKKRQELEANIQEHNQRIVDLEAVRNFKLDLASFLKKYYK